MKQFAEFYSAKFKIEPAKLMKRLWGDQFYNAKDKKWAKSFSEGYVRGFNQFILDPIYKVRRCTILKSIIETIQRFTCPLQF